MKKENEKENPIFQSKNGDLKAILNEASKNLAIKNKEVQLNSVEHQEVKAEILDWKTKQTKTVQIKEFEIPKQLIDVTLSTSEYFGLILYGEGGVGKTILTLSQVKSKLKPDLWEYGSGYSTPLSLYQFLYQNRHKEVIILDDIEGLLQNRISISILKCALSETDNKRIVTYTTTSDKLTVPTSFVINANIFILCNRIPKAEDRDTQALMSRTITYEVAFSYKQKLAICGQFILGNNTLTSEQKQAVLGIIKQHTNEATKNFNFRTLKKVIAFVKWDNTKAIALFQAITETDELKEAYLLAVKEYHAVKDQTDYFREITGKSRRTFFYIHKQMSAKVQSKTNVALKGDD